MLPADSVPAASVMLKKDEVYTNCKILGLNYDNANLRLKTAIIEEGGNACLSFTTLPIQ